jgi:hypothetical protein
VVFGRVAEWYTRYAKDVVGQPMQVQVLSRPPYLLYTCVVEKFETSQSNYEPEYAEKLPGQIFQKSDNSLAVGLSKSDGLSVREIWSTDNLEEDLSLLPNKSEKYQDVINRSLKSILSHYGNYLNPDNLKKTFPNLEVNNIESYDFNNSNIKFFVLKQNDFMTFKEAFEGSGPKVDTTYVGGHKGPSDSIDMPLKLSNGNQLLHYEILNIGQKELIFTGEPNKGESRDMEETIRHELLHALGAGKLFFPTSKLNEGVISYYAQKSMSEDEGHSYVNEKLVEYKEQYKVIDRVLGLTELMGITEETRNKALLGNDPASVEELKNALTAEMGHEFVYKLFGGGFDKYKGGWEGAINDLDTHGEALYFKNDAKDEQD